MVGERRLRGASFLLLPVMAIPVSLLLKIVTWTTFAPEILIYNHIHELFLVFIQVQSQHIWGASWLIFRVPATVHQRSSRCILWRDMDGFAGCLRKCERTIWHDSSLKTGTHKESPNHDNSQSILSSLKQETFLILVTTPTAQPQHSIFPITRLCEPVI